MNNQQLLQKIGDKIVEIKHSKDWNQSDLAARCNLQKSNVSRIDTGRANMTTRTLLKISQGLVTKLITLLDVE